MKFRGFLFMKKCTKCGKLKPFSEFYKHRKWLRPECKSCKKSQSKRYRDKNPELTKERDKKRWNKRKDRNNFLKKKRNKERRKQDSLFKLKCNIRSLVYMYLAKEGHRKSLKTEKILGCSFEDLIKHLNNNPWGFKYGDKDLDIDHIIPLSRCESKKEIIESFHFKNLQLLPKEYNRSVKSNKTFNKDHFEEWLKSKLNQI